jgi:hypothetical protein
MNNTLERVLTEYENDLPSGPLGRYDGGNDAVLSPDSELGRRELRRGYQRYIALIVTVLALVYFFSR